MKLEDEILISAYIDNEVSTKEKIYVEELIEKDSKAREFYNQLLITENQLKDFFSSNSVKELNESFQKKYLKRNSFFGVLYNSFRKPWRVAILVLAAPLFFITPAGYIALNDPEINNLENRGVIVKSERQQDEINCSGNSKLFNFFVRIFDEDYCKTEN